MIRQEILSGLRTGQRFIQVRDALRGLDDVLVSTSDHERAAEMYSICQASGVQGSVVDFLICAVAERLDVPVLATDADFARYASFLTIKLHGVP
jgi:predicted nucleic acid-binding protein